MKVRTGFVSNSSSSSFVVLGVAIKDDAESKEMLTKLGFSESEYDGDEWEFFENKKIDGIEYLYVEEDNGVYGLVGKVYADVSNDGDPLESQHIPLERLTITAYEVANKLGVDVSRVQLYMGTRPS